MCDGLIGVIVQHAAGTDFADHCVGFVCFGGVLVFRDVVSKRVWCDAGHMCCTEWHTWWLAAVVADRKKTEVLVMFMATEVLSTRCWAKRRQVVAAMECGDKGLDHEAK